jgi:hypothetical protein
MANARAGNKYFVTTTGALTESRTLVAGILFTPDAANDSMTLKESSDGDEVFFLRGATAKQSQYYSFPLPIVFGGGIYVSAITSGAKAVFILTEAGK